MTFKKGDRVRWLGFRHEYEIIAQRRFNLFTIRNLETKAEYLAYDDQLKLDATVDDSADYESDFN